MSMTETPVNPGYADAVTVVDLFPAEQAEVGYKVERRVGFDVVICPAARCNRIVGHYAACSEQRGRHRTSR